MGFHIVKKTSMLEIACDWRRYVHAKIIICADIITDECATALLFLSDDWFVEAGDCETVD